MTTFDNIKDSMLATMKSTELFERAGKKIAYIIYSPQGNLVSLFDNMRDYDRAWFNFTDKTKFRSDVLLREKDKITMFMTNHHKEKR